MSTTIKRPADAFCAVVDELRPYRHSLRPVRHYEPDEHHPELWIVYFKCQECGYGAAASVEPLFGRLSVFLADTVPHCTATP